ncbi:MAG: hypothetical protein ABJQ70_14160 [Roseobacter sp.]
MSCQLEGSACSHAWQLPQRSDSSDVEVPDLDVPADYYFDASAKPMGWMAPASTDVAMRHNAGVDIC